jgi:hypothetical protein
VELDTFASFPRLVCQTNVLNPLLRKGKIPSIARESNPAPLGWQSAMLTTTPFRPQGQIALKWGCASFFKVFIVRLNLLHENSSFFQVYLSWRWDIFFVVTVRSMWSLCVCDFVTQTNEIRGIFKRNCFKDSLIQSLNADWLRWGAGAMVFGTTRTKYYVFNEPSGKKFVKMCWLNFSLQQPWRWLP